MLSYLYNNLFPYIQTTITPFLYHSLLLIPTIFPLIDMLIYIDEDEDEDDFFE